jgi:hypothetical protein
MSVHWSVFVKFGTWTGRGVDSFKKRLLAQRHAKQQSANERSDLPTSHIEIAHFDRLEFVYDCLQLDDQEILA